MMENKSAEEPYFPERWISTVRDETLDVWVGEIERKKIPLLKELARLGQGLEEIEAERKRRAAARKERNGRPKAVAHEEAPQAGSGVP